MWSLFWKKFPIGIDIGDFSIEAVRLDPVRKKVVAGRVTCGESVIRRGRIADRAQLVRKLSEALDMAKPQSLMPRRGSVSAIVSLPESQTFTYVFEVDSDLGGEKLRGHVLDTVRGVIPLELEESRWDFEVSSDDGSTKKRVVFVSSPSDVVEEFIDVLREAHLNPVVLDTELMSISRAVLDGGDGPTLLMDLGANRTLIGVVDGGGVPYLSVSVPVGGKHMTKMIAGITGKSEGEAEKIKREEGYKEQQGEHKVRDALVRALNPVVKETEGMLRHADGLFPTRIENIVLVGGVSLTPGIESLLAGLLGRSVRRADPAVILRSEFSINVGSYIWGESPNVPVLFTTAIGLALRGARQETLDNGINLLGKREYAEGHMQMVKAGKRAKKRGSGRGRERGGKERKMIMSARSVAILVFFVVSIVILAFALYKYVFSTPEVVGPVQTVPLGSDSGGRDGAG